MDLGEINSVAYQLMKDRKSHLDREKGYIYYHGKRVSKISINLRKELLPYDNSYDDYLIAASLFHDIGKGFKPHEEYGALLVQDILKDNCNQNEIKIIAELIKFHQGPRKDKSLSPYIKIIQDADILDRFGTMQIWLNIQDSATKDLPIEHTLDFYKNRLELYMKEMRNYLNFELSLEIFDEKAQYLNSFIKRFIAEAQGDFYSK